MGYIALALLLLGIVLLLIEIFIPGFGVFGITGLISLAVSACLTIMFVDNGIVIVVSGIVILAVLGYLAFEDAKKYGLYNKLVLKDTLKNDKESKENMDSFVNKTGVVKTPLKPHGKVEFDGTVTEAYSDGDFIPVGQQVVAYKVSDNNLYVKIIK